MELRTTDLMIDVLANKKKAPKRHKKPRCKPRSVCGRGTRWCGEKSKHPTRPACRTRSQCKTNKSIVVSGCTPSSNQRDPDCADMRLADFETLSSALDLYIQAERTAA